MEIQFILWWIDYIINKNRNDLLIITTFPKYLFKTTELFPNNVSNKMLHSYFFVLLTHS